MELLSTIVEQSNKYPLQKNTSLDLFTDELHVFLGILLFSVYGKYPNRRIYWSNEDDVPKIVQDSMRLNRFEKILKHIHFSGNAALVQEDRLYKIRPLIDKLAKNLRQHGGLQEHLSIDESMVSYYGKHYAKQYIRGKPIRFGFKNWALCTNEGYMVGFDIYTGNNSSLEKHFGVGGDIVLALLQQTEVPKNQGYKIYFDNYFTSLPLLAHLSAQKYCATGTIRENRIEQCPVPMQWKDNKVVSIASNFEDNSIGNVTRWDRVSKSKKNLPRPKIVAGYNKGMGGVDKLDGLVAVYRTRIRQRKWYWPLVGYLLDVSVVNGWLLMKRLKPDGNNAQSLLAFRRYIALTLLKSFGSKPHQGRVSNPLTDVRFDNTGHMIICNNTDRRCKHCGKKNARDTSAFESRQKILESFNAFSSKDEQDSHLSGLISFSAPQRRRPRNIYASDSDENLQHRQGNGAVFFYKVRLP
ncbi:transposase is4 [Holotrichia oblita]|uniref:Transposase is4 n=1 Tax=Holotrichia oblita TaxID=644536 RepID=A0ACB9SQ32_HOLOL|nr:transposase is4 [Holotrichia oblita]